ncbi:MAG: lipopolysaccharide biosynthesis protein [Alphaproteobacteria bacterium]
MSIQTKMVKGAFWLFLEKGAQQISSFVVFAVIVRLIGPEEYGLVALCAIVLSLTNNISLGLVDSIISMKIRDDERLSSLFWLVSGIGAFMGMATFSLSDSFAWFFGEEKLLPLLQVFSIIPLLFALSAVPTALIKATMDFKAFTLRTLVASLIGGAVGLYFAFYGWGAYAIAFQQITAAGIAVIVLFGSTPWRPRFVFKITTLKEMLHLGVGQTSSLLLSFTEQQMPRFILGYFIDPVAVGHYAFVRRIIGVLQDGVIQPVLDVVYPAMSEIIDNEEEKRRVISQCVFVLGLVAFPMVAGLVLTAPLFVPLLFGEKWVEAAPYLQFLAPAMFFISFNVFLMSILRAHRQIFVSVWVQAFIIVFATFGYLLFVPYGVQAVIVVLVVSSFAGTIALSVAMQKIVNVPIAREAYILFSSLMASITMAGLVFLVVNSGIFYDNFITLIAGITIGITSYALMLTLLERKRLQNILLRIKRSRA